MTEYSETELLNFVLPHKHRPGSDLMTKHILNNTRIMDIVVAGVIGDDGLNKYTVAPCEWIDGRRSDVLYVPKANSPDLPPILIEAQHTMYMPFIKRIIKYCSHIYDKYRIEPIAVTLCIREMRSEILELLSTTEKPFLMQLGSDFWAKAHFVLSGNTIANSLGDSPLDPLVALMYVLTSQEMSLLSLEHRTDPTVQMVYTIAKTALDHEVRNEEATVDVLVDVCKHFRQQFDRTRMALDQDGGDQKRARTYLADGIEYADLCINRYTREQPSTSTMPSPPMLPEGVHSAGSRESARIPLRAIDGPQQESDMEWAANYVQKKKDAKRRMNWSACFEEGRELGYFKGFSNVTSLKNTFNAKKNRK